MVKDLVVEGWNHLQSQPTQMKKSSGSWVDPTPGVRTFSLWVESSVSDLAGKGVGKINLGRTGCI
jgi:hypothetical protein